MIEKLVISINWVIGSLAIGFCLISGNLIGEGGLSKSAIKKTMVAAVESIARHQNSKRDTSGTGEFITFSRNPADMKKALGISEAPQGDFTLEAFVDSSEALGKYLVIRAVASRRSVLNERAQPLIYQKIIPADGGVTREEWIALSNLPYGLNIF